MKKQSAVNLFPLIKGLLVLGMLAVPAHLMGQSQTIPLWEGEPPNTKKLITEDEIGEGGRIERVSEPELTVYLPDEDAANGAAVMICPGGGYSILAIEHEGYEIAEAYSKRGYVAAVLKYRLPDEDLVEESWNVPLSDALQGIKKIRQNSEEWAVDPEKVGILGFSAGGHLASTASVHGEPSHHPEENSRPDFSILVYPVISMEDTTIAHMGSRENLLDAQPKTGHKNRFSSELQIDSTTPPAFLVHSWDDEAVLPENSIRYAETLNQHEILTELHLFEKGGHGYGIGDRARHGNAAEWLDLSHRWLQMLFEAE